MSVTASTTVSEDIRDIRGPKSDLISSAWLPVLTVAAIVLLVGMVILYRRRGKSAPLREPTLLEQTLERLEGTKLLMKPATAREFGRAASEVIRQYIEKRFNVVATQRTTEEFLQALLQGSNETLARHRPLLADFLQRCDFVKFAGASLAESDMESLYNSARGFVVETSTK